MASVDEVLELLREKADPGQLEGMARYGMSTEKRLGVKIPDLRQIAKEIGKDHSLALALWASGVAEARILASMVDQPAEVSGTQMETWAADFDSWDVCDQVCMNLFEKTPLAWEKIPEWSLREEEYVKRAAYALIACLAWHDKRAQDEAFIGLLPVIARGAADGRNYVKKAVSWALRNTGKRNLRLNQVALQTARELQAMEAKPARWVGADALRDLTSEATRSRLSK
ncbi:MAG: DNA alkylation repair protein [Anaerolineales bacterium]|nr:DNA alkylation repair protein [Anaerolineales bacterium]